MLRRTMDPTLRARAVAEIVAALGRALGADLVGAILKGSARNGDFIPNWSDLDVHAFVAAPAMQGARRLRRERALALQRELGRFDAAGYGLGSLQLYCLNADEHPREWVKPLPGTYELVAGRLPEGFVEIDRDGYRAKAGPDVDAAIAFIASRAESIIDTPDAELAAVVRRVGIDMKCLAYAVPIVAGADPERAWRWPLRAALEAAEALAFPTRPLSAFFALVEPWPAEPERARRMLERAFDAADEARAWRG